MNKTAKQTTILIAIIFAILVLVTALCSTIAGAFDADASDQSNDYTALESEPEQIESTEEQESASTEASAELDETYFEDATVIAETVNLRLRPTTDSPVVTELVQGNRIGVFCEEQPGWYRVIFGNYRGYVSSEYIFLPSTDTMIGHVMVDGLHLRPNPTTECDILCDVPVGNAVKIDDICGDWYLVETEILVESAESDTQAAETTTTTQDTDQAAETEATESDPEQADTEQADTEQADTEEADTEEADTEEADTEEADTEEADTEDTASYETMTGYVHKDYINLSSTKSTSPLLKPGMTGVSIADMQRELKRRGFFAGAATGYYGDVTLAAVQLFQEEAGIAQDGIVGETTLELLYGDNDIKTNAAKIAGIEGAVQLSTWNEIEKVFARGDTALVTDVKTGLQYTVYRFGGWWHADCEPLTAEDTAIMKQIYGGTWSWDRRAIWVTIDGVTYAASQNGMPHLSSPVEGNDFDGHFCIHFNDSMVHQTGNECPRHQACVEYAYEMAQ